MRDASLVIYHASALSSVRRVENAVFRPSDFMVDIPLSFEAKNDMMNKWFGTFPKQTHMGVEDCMPKVVPCSFFMRGVLSCRGSLQVQS